MIKIKLLPPVLLLGGILMFTAVVSAETISVEYKRFYSHVKKLNNEDTQALQFAFGFQHIHHDRLCVVNEAKIITEKQTLLLKVTPEYRFTMPSERALNLADAVVQIVLQDKANQCDMSVQLETKAEYLKQYYSKQDLEFLFRQYSAFFNSMGSFLSFMMPQVDGLMVQFHDLNLDQQLRNAPDIVNGILILDNGWLRNPKPIVLPIAPLRITAHTSK